MGSIYVYILEMGNLRKNNIGKFSSKVVKMVNLGFYSQVFLLVDS